MTRSILTVCCLCLLASATTALAQNQRDEAVRADKQEFAESSSWVYNDFQAAQAAARRANKPLFVVFR